MLAKVVTAADSRVEVPKVEAQRVLATTAVGGTVREVEVKEATDMVEEVRARAAAGSVGVKKGWEVVERGGEGRARVVVATEVVAAGAVEAAAAMMAAEYGQG